MGAYNPLTVRGSLRCAVRKAIISLSDGSARNQSAGDFSFERWQQSRRRTTTKVLTQKKATKEVQKGATKEPQKKATKEVQKGARTELHKGARKGLQKGARKAPSKKKKRLTSRQTKPSSTRKRSSKHRKRSASTRRRSRNGRGSNHRRRSRNGRGSNHRRRSAYKRSYTRSTRGRSARRIQKGSRMRAQEYEAIESYGDRENIEMLLGESTRQVPSTRRRKEKATEEESTYANAKLDLRELNRAEAFKLLKETAAVMVV